MLTTGLLETWVQRPPTAGITKKRGPNFSTRCIMQHTVLRSTLDRNGCSILIDFRRTALRLKFHNKVLHIKTHDFIIAVAVE